MNTQDLLQQIEAKLATAKPTAAPAVQVVTAPPKKVDAVEPPATVQAAAPGVPPIAIVGLSGYFPQSQSVAEFWQAIDEDRCLLEEIPPTRFHWADYYDPTGTVPMKSHTKWGGFIPDIRSFDVRLFQRLPKEAKLLDPRQRLLLMSVYQSVEDAGYAPDSWRKTRTGFFVGAEENEYVKLSYWDKTQSEGMDNAPSMIANQISYFFDWRGPSEYINTLCAGGAVAIHRAVAAIRAGECAQAVVGVANVLLRPETFISLSAMKQMSRSPTVNPFGKDAAGYLPAEGVASIVLKPLPQAEADGDAIYALLKHTAVNFNGQGGMSIASPNVAAHSALIQQCYREASIDPRDLRYIEAQGMANPITDIAEWSAFNRALREYAAEQQVDIPPGHCFVSTLKPMIGHMQSASAFGALFRIIRSLHTEKIHKILNFQQPSPDLILTDQPCQLAADTQPWPRQDRPRLAALHSYGSGGNNAHLLVEEYVAPAPPATGANTPQVVPFSAHTLAQCRQWIAAMIDTVAAHAEIDWPALAYTLQVGRNAMTARVAFVAADRAAWLSQAPAYLATAEDAPPPAGVWVSEARRPTLDPTVDPTLAALAHAWTQGQAVTWPVPEPRPTRLHLPTYPFALKPYWLDLPATPTTAAPTLPVTASSTGANATRTAPAMAAPAPTFVEKELPPMTAKLDVISAQPSQTAGEKAAELFTYCAETSDQDFHEDYLTFCPFPERIPGFSMTRVFLNPKQYRKEMALIQRKQIEMRQVLFFKEDFNQIRYLLDFGCGHGTDVIQIAHHYPHIHTDGFTITKAQADLGTHRIAQKGLTGRARIFHHDSTKVKFPRNEYDVAIGLEVSCLIQNKDGLFSNLEQSLRNHGRLLLIDFIANLHGAIEDPTIDIYIPTPSQWAKNLAKHHLVIDEVVDVSPQIANFQHDPEHEENTKHCPKVVRDSWRNYANNAIAIDRGWLSYVLFRIRKDQYSDPVELEQQNLSKLQHQKPYPVALAEMQKLDHAPYPILDESVLADAYPDARKARANVIASSDDSFIALQQQLSTIFNQTLSLSEQEIAQAANFQALGITSIHSVELLEAINSTFNLSLPTSLIFEQASLSALTQYLHDYLSQHQPAQLAQLASPSVAPIAPMLQAVPAPAAEPPLKIKLLDLFSSALQLAHPEFTASDPFNELGLTSINAVELMQAINSEFNLSLPTSVVFECNSINGLFDYLTAAGVTLEGSAQKKSMNPV